MFQLKNTFTTQSTLPFNQTIDHYSLLTYKINYHNSLFIFPHFYLMSSPHPPVIASKMMRRICSHVFLGSLFLFLITLIVLRSTSKVFYRIFLNWDLSIFFFHDSCSSVFWGGLRSKELVSSHNKGTYYQCDLSLLSLTLIPGLGSIY